MRRLIFLTCFLALTSCESGKDGKSSNTAMEKTGAPAEPSADQLSARYKGLLLGLPEFDYTKARTDQEETEEYRKIVGLYIEKSSYESYLKGNIFTFRQRNFDWGKSPIPTWRFVKVVDFDRSKNEFSVVDGGAVDYFKTAESLNAKEGLEKYRKLAGPDIEKSGFEDILEEKKRVNSQIPSPDYDQEEVSQFVVQFLVELASLDKEALKKVVPSSCVFESADGRRWDNSTAIDQNATFADLKDLSELFHEQILGSEATFRIGINLFENIDKASFVRDFAGVGLAEVVTDDNYNALILGVQKKGKSYEVVYIKNLIYAE